MARNDSSRRRAGVLLPIGSLPGPDGIGTLGEHSLAWLEWLRAARVSLWQVLPTGPLAWGNSPYSSLSSFAGNPLYISSDGLARDSWISQASLADRPAFERDRIDYRAAAEWKERCLREAWSALAKSPDEKQRRFRAFRESPEQVGWLADWALFAALRHDQNERSWVDWPRELRLRQPEAIEEARQRLAREIEYREFVQFLFFDQYASMRRNAAALGIELVGDLPFYPALDSADAWSHPELFDLRDSGRPLRVAGVPPDAFTVTGQLWGNPLYRWDRMRENGYSWWVSRARANLRLVDHLRLDHFRGFAAYWAVAGDATTAIDGSWEPGPGKALFEATRRALGHLPFIAEDLGVITADVRRLRRDTGLAGMRVLQFAFDEPESEHLPHRLPRDCVVYTGTHDNDTTLGWFERRSRRERRRILDYIGGAAEDIAWSLVRTAMVSPADWSVIPVQDLLGMGPEARLNTPGRSDDQWTWRLSSLPSQQVARGLARLIAVSGRSSRAIEADESE